MAVLEVCEESFLSAQESFGILLQIFEFVAHAVPKEIEVDKPVGWRHGTRRWDITATRTIRRRTIGPVGSVLSGIFWANSARR